MENDYLIAKEVCFNLNISQATLWNIRKKLNISKKIGGRRLFSKNDFYKIKDYLIKSRFHFQRR